MKKDNSAVWDTSLPISTKAIAIAMAEHVGASQAQLARYASCSDRLIRKALKQLIEHGLIEQVPAKNCSFVPRNQGDVYMPTWLDPSESLNRNNEPELCAGLAVNRNDEPAHSSGLDLAQESQHARGSLFSSYEENKEHTKEQQQPRAHTREGVLDEQSKSKSVRPVADDTRGHSRGDDPHGSAHPLPDVHPSADARGSDAPSPTHRAEDEGSVESLVLHVVRLMSEYWVDANSATAGSIVTHIRATTPDELVAKLPDMVESAIKGYAGREGKSRPRTASGCARFLRDDWLSKIVPQYTEAARVQQGHRYDAPDTYAFMEENKRRHEQERAAYKAPEPSYPDLARLELVLESSIEFTDALDMFIEHYPDFLERMGDEIAAAYPREWSLYHSSHMGVSA